MSRSAPTPRPEHDLLRRYLAAWTAAVVPRRPEPEAEAAGGAHLLYLDGFAAGADAALGRSDFASVLLGLEALRGAAERAARRGVPLRTTAVLLEEDPEQLRRLRARLEAAGWAERLREAAGDAPPLDDGAVLLLQGAAAERLPPLVERAGAGVNALCFLDPPAAAALPLPLLRSLAAAGVDVLLRFPAADFRRLQRFPAMPLADLPPYARRVVQGGSALLGDERHAWMAHWRRLAAEGGVAAAERAMLHALRERLAAEGGWVARAVSAPLPAGAAEELHLLLLTPAPERALALNRALHEARVEGRLGWPAPGEPAAEPAALVRHEQTGVLDLFGGAGEGAGAWVRRVELPAVAEWLARAFAGRRVAFAEVLASLAATELFAEEVRRALGLLKQAGRAAYAGLGAVAEVAFAAPGERLAAPVAGRARARRAPPEQLGVPIADEP